MKTEITFEDYLKKGNLSGNTIESYLWTVNYFTTNYEKVSKENLLAYKGSLSVRFSPPPMPCSPFPAPSNSHKRPVYQHFGTVSMLSIAGHHY